MFGQVMETLLKPTFQHEPMTAFTFESFQAKDMVTVLMSASNEASQNVELDDDENTKVHLVERALARTLGNFEKVTKAAVQKRELAFDEEPYVLVIPNRKIRLIRCLGLVETFDKTVGVLHQAWIDELIPLRKRSETIKTLQGRLYNLFHRLLQTPTR